MGTHADEFGGVEQRLLEQALDVTGGQFDVAEAIVAKRYAGVSGDARSLLVTAVAQVIATNYLAAATVRNLPKG
jgi:hypothetical protein